MNYKQMSTDELLAAIDRLTEDGKKCTTPICAYQIDDCIREIMDVIVKRKASIHIHQTRDSTKFLLTVEDEHYVFDETECEASEIPEKVSAFLAILKDYDAPKHFRGI
jgi:hypothetical protein